MSTIHLHIEGMSCQGCANSIEKGLKSNRQVKNAHVDLASKLLTVDGEVSEAEMISQVEAMGYAASPSSPSAT